MNYSFSKIASPVGQLTLIASDNGLAAVLWEQEPPHRIRDFKAMENNDHPILKETEKQLSVYFAGDLQHFHIPLDTMGTDFQKQVWKALQEIPYGQTRTYGQLAIMLGDINRSRAVGSANHRNPVSIIVPCHRVVGATGKLTGFAGGLEAKAFLLKLEGADQHSNQQQLQFSFSE